MRQSSQLGQESINKLILKFSIPAIVGMLVNALYNVVDRIFVGHGVGQLGLAGITVSFPLTLMIMAINMLIGIGGSTLVSIRLGEKKDEEAREVLQNSFVLLVGLSMLITVIGLVFLDPILSLLGASAEVLPYAKDYGSVILAGTIFFTLGMGMNNFIRAEGNPRVAMITMLIGAITNIILDPIFIFGFGWGVRGAAIATVISKAVSAVWVLYYLINNSQVKLRVKNVRLKATYVAGILVIGAAPFARQLAASMLNVILNNSLGIYGGDLAQAAMGIIFSLSTLFLMPIIGLNQGLQPIIGYNYGANEPARVKEALRKGLVGATLISLVGFGLVTLFPNQLVNLFTSDQELLQFTPGALRAFLMMLPIIGAQIIGSGYFQAVGRPKPAAVLSLSRQILFLIPAIIILPRYFGVDGVFYAAPLADVLSFIVTGIWVIREMRKLDKGHTGEFNLATENH